MEFFILEELHRGKKGVGGVILLMGHSENEAFTRTILEAIPWYHRHYEAKGGCPRSPKVGPPMKRVSLPKLPKQTRR